MLPAISIVQTVTGHNTVQRIFFAKDSFATLMDHYKLTYTVAISSILNLPLICALRFD